MRKEDFCEHLKMIRCSVVYQRSGSFVNDAIWWYHCESIQLSARWSARASTVACRRMSYECWVMQFIWLSRRVLMTCVRVCMCMHMCVHVHVCEPLLVRLCVFLFLWVTLFYSFILCVHKIMVLAFVICSIMGFLFLITHYPLILS